MSSHTESKYTYAETRTSHTSGIGSSTHTRYTSTRAGALIEAVVWSVRVRRAVVGAARSSVRWIRETVTPAGWLVVVAAFVVLPLGLALGWAEFVLAGLVGVTLLVVSLPFLSGGRAYGVDFTLPVERVVAGSEVTGTLRITNTSRRIELPGRIDVPIGQGLTDVHVPLLRPGHVHEETVSVPAYRRGVIDVGPVTTVRSDPLGVLKRELSWADVHRLFVHPVTVSIPSTSSGFVRDLEGNPTSDIVASDISFHAIREYAPGDSQRHIHWKSTAKTGMPGKFMVRQFEETRRSRLVVALSLNTAEYASADEFELAVSAAGSLGVRAIRDGRDVAVVASEEIPEIVRAAVRSIRSLSVVSGRTLLDDLTAIDSSPRAMSIEQVCALTSQVVPDISIAFVVCGSTITTKRLQALALTFPAGIAVVAVICNPQGKPSFRDLSGTAVLSIEILDDFRSLLSRRSA